MHPLMGITNSTAQTSSNLSSSTSPALPQLYADSRFWNAALASPNPTQAIDATLSALAGPQQASGSSSQEPPPKNPLLIGSLLPNTFLHGFLLSLSMIIVGELGDKTFIISALMSMKHPRSLVFWASFGALAVMTALSVAFGVILPSLIEPKWTRIAAGILFLVFGAKAVYDGWRMPKDSTSVAHTREYSEVAQEVGAIDESGKCDADLETGPSEHTQTRPTLVSVFLQIFSLVFFAEWGDRSQLAVIALAASENMLGVAAGAIAGHAICTLLACLAGRLLARVLSVRTVTMLGGMLFLVFGVLAIGALIPIERDTVR